MVRTTMAAAALLCALLVAAGEAGAVGPGTTLTWPGGGRGEVRFEGKEHSEKSFACKDCHPGLFSMKHGTAAMTMASLNGGRYCGVCHNGTAAFSTRDPKKCHECHRDDHKHGRQKEHEEKKHKHDD
jgi:c(7)-type cytochrome triheme protein